MTTAPPRPLLALDALGDYLDSQGIGAGPVEAERLGDGHSNLTYLLRRAGVEVVLRRPPAPPLPPGAHDMMREARLLKALGPTGLPVPRVVAVEETGGVIGAPFYLTARVLGHVITTALPPAFEAQLERRTLVTELVEQLVAIHDLDWRTAGLGYFAKSSGYLERQLRVFERLWDANKTREIRAVDLLARWLNASVPRTPETTVVHGDYRLGNVMYAPVSEPRIAAIFDWEMATLGDPLADLGYLVATYAQATDPVNPVASLTPVTAHPDFPSREEVVELYASRTGRDVSDIRWFVGLAMWKSIVFMEGNYRRARFGGSGDAFAERFATDGPPFAEFALTLAMEGTTR